MRPTQILVFVILLAGAVGALMWGRLKFEEPEVTLPYEPAQLRLQVVDGDQPVAGMNFRLQFSPMESSVYELTSHQQFDLLRAVSASTDENGIANFEHLLPHATYSFVDTPLASFAANEGELLELRLNLAKSASIQGVLAGPDGESLANRRVQLFEGGTSAPSVFVRQAYGQAALADVSTDTQGRFGFENIGFGEYHVVFEPDDSSGLCAVQAPARLTEDQAHVEVELTLAEGVMTRGRVVTTDGEAVAQAQIWGALSGARVVLEVSTNEQGEFTTPRLPLATSLEFEAMHEGVLNPQVVVVESGRQDVVLVWEAGASMRGSVEVLDDPLARVAYQSMNGASFTSHSGVKTAEFESGDDFEFDGLSPGVYTILAQSESGELARSEPVTLQAGQRVDSIKFEKVPAQRVEFQSHSPVDLMYQVIDGEQALLGGYLAPNVRSAALLPVGEFEIEIARWVQDEDENFAWRRHRIPLKVNRRGTTVVKLERQ